MVVMASHRRAGGCYQRARPIPVCWCRRPPGREAACQTTCARLTSAALRPGRTAESPGSGTARGEFPSVLHPAKGRTRMERHVADAAHLPVRWRDFTSIIASIVIRLVCPCICVPLQAEGAIRIRTSRRCARGVDVRRRRGPVDPARRVLSVVYGRERRLDAWQRVVADDDPTQRPTGPPVVRHAELERVDVVRDSDDEYPVRATFIVRRQAARGGLPFNVSRRQSIGARPCRSTPRASSSRWSRPGRRSGSR